jgi:predicted amidohydrolase YtcJ
MKIYYNGPILTMNDEQKIAEMLIEKDGRILFVGRELEGKNYIEDNADWIDLQGYTLMPAMLDGHSHFSQTATSLQTVNLSNATCHADIINLIRRYLKTYKDMLPNIIMAMGYDHNFLHEHRHPTKEVLDAACPDHPLVAWHASMHMCCVNSAMLRLLHITSDTPDPQGGRIGRVEGYQEPDGFLEECACNEVRALTDKEYTLSLDDLARAEKYYMTNGILTIQDGACTQEVFDYYKRANERNFFSADVIAYPCFNFGQGLGTTMEDNPEYIRSYKGHLKIGGYKLLLDGSPQCKSAWLSKPYEGEATYCGYPWLNDDQVEQDIAKAVEEKQQILVHCNGDAASDQFINAYEKVLKRYPNDPVRQALRPTMIHCQTVRLDQLDRMKALNMIASIFVGHVYYWGDIHVKNLGPERAAHISPVRSAMERGIVTNFHTDTPVTEPCLFHSVWTAVNRITRDGNILGPAERVDVYDALKAVTINAAYSYFEEDSKGSLEPGKLADMIVLTANPLTVHKMDLQHITVKACIKAGKTVYKAD